LSLLGDLCVFSDPRDVRNQGDRRPHDSVAAFDQAVARLSDEGTRRLLKEARPGMIRGMERPDAGDA
jgi:hypothetical protein